MTDALARARRDRRRAWPVRVFALGHEPPDDLRATTTAEERLEMVWPLTVQAFELAGIPVGPVPREAMRVRIVRR